MIEDFFQPSVVTPPEPIVPLEIVTHDLYTREVQSLALLQDMRRCNDSIIDLGTLTGEELEGYKLLSDALASTYNALVARVNYRKQLNERMAHDARRSPEQQIAGSEEHGTVPGAGIPEGGFDPSLGGTAPA